MIVVFARSLNINVRASLVLANRRAVSLFLTFEVMGPWPMTSAQGREHKASVHD